MTTRPLRLVFLVHYFPPINSSGAKRVEAISKFLAAAGHDVTVVTTQKRSRDGTFSEAMPPGVRVLELDAFGRLAPSRETGAPFQPMYTERRSWTRRLKDLVMAWCGQLPDPRLPFALSLASPLLAREVGDALRAADVVVGSSPPWPMLLAAVIAKRRFGARCVLDYRDQFSECHEMPGGRLAKAVELMVDRWLVHSADHVVAISEPMARYLERFGRAVTTIRNGYDPEMLAQARAQARTRPAGDGRVVIRYMGLVSPGRVPHRFLAALARLAREDRARFERLRIEYYGFADLVRQAVAERYPEIAGAFAFHPNQPYLDALRLMTESDYLLFCETSSTESLSAQGILTTKLLEYIGSGRPVLADISDATLAGGLLRQCGAQHVIGDTPDVFSAAFARADFYERRPDEVSATAASLSRKAQAESYARLAASLAGVPEGRATPAEVVPCP